MSLTRRLLACTDFSAAGNSAAAFAVDLAAQLHAEVVLTNTFDGDVMMQRELVRPSSVREVEGKREVVLARLLELARRLARPGLSIDCVPVHGDPRSEIPRLARQESADLIVVGRYGHSGLSRLFVGSVADSVIRNASVPVLAVGENALAAAAQPVRVPADGAAAGGGRA